MDMRQHIPWYGAHISRVSEATCGVLFRQGLPPDIAAPPAAYRAAASLCRGGWMSRHFSIDNSLCMGYITILAP
jgi:hypothetical protein